MAVDPTSIANLSNIPGTQIDFTVNVTDAPAINGFSVILTYNFTVLHALTLDTSNNILAGQPLFVLRNCVDGQGQCFSGDGVGVVSYAATIQGNITVTPSPPGRLFRISFQVKDHGFSQIQIQEAVLSTGRLVGGKPEQIQVSTFDGFFANIDCPRNSGNPCLPPTPVFTWSPQPPVQDRIVTFNASRSIPGPGLNTNITRYFWSWGESARPTDTDQNVTEHIFKLAGNYRVTLQITDTNGISWSKTSIVTVINILVDLGIEDVLARPRNYQILPGTIINITASVRNLGVAFENATLGISLEGLLLKKAVFLNLPPQTVVSLQATWDTTNYRARVYRIDASVAPVLNETNVRNNVRSTWVQVIEPSPGGLGIGLLASTGIGALGLGGAGFAVSRLRRRRPATESLTLQTL